MSIITEAATHNTPDNHRKPRTPEAPFDKKPKIKDLPDLKICEHYDEIIDIIDHNDISLLICATGTGKTIGTPLMLLKAHPDARIVITQPRNAPMEKIASRTAELIGTKVGDLVGVRYKGSGKKWNEEKTQIMYTMEQSLLNDLKKDPLLESIDIVHLDEVHENNVLTQELFQQLVEIQRIRKEKGIKPLKIILTSATVDKDKMSKKMGNAKAYEIENSIPPKHIEKKYSKEKIDIRKIPEEAAATVKNIIDTKKEKSDILVFLPGKKEIERFFEELDKLNVSNEQYTRLTLFSGSTEAEKDRINNRQGDQERIIVSTPSGETGYSFPSPLKYEVDSGLIKQVMIDPATGMEYMETILHSWSGLMQRDGRLGRLEDGEARHLYTEEQLEEQERTYKYTTPEIRRMSLIRPLLDILTHGGNTETLLKYPDPPDPMELQRAQNSLQLLGALNSDGSLNEIGQEMAEVDVDDVHLARMIVAAKKMGSAEAACTIAAMMEKFQRLIEGNSRETDAVIKLFQDKNSRSDYMTLITLWKQIDTHKEDTDWLKKHKINLEVWESIVKKRGELMKGLESGGVWDADTVGKFVLVGYADQLVTKNSDNTYQFLATSANTSIHIDNDSAASGSGTDVAIIGSIYKRDNETYAQNIQPINPEWVKEMTPWMLKENDQSPHFNPDTKSVEASHDTYLGSKIISRKPVPVDKEVAFDIFASALTDGKVTGIDFVDKNKDAIRGITPEETEKNKEKLKKLYLDKLAHISSVKELETALSQHPELAHMLEIHPDDLKPSQRKEPESHNAETSSASTHESPKHQKESFLQRAGQKIEQTWNKFMAFMRSLKDIFRPNPPHPAH